MPAGAAQGERRIAAAVEEQQGLLAAFERGLHRLGQSRRDETPARRAADFHIDRFDMRQMLAAETLRQRQAAITAAPRIDLGFDRRRRRRQDDRKLLDARAHHRHVARVIVNAVFLLVGLVVLFIDDDQAEIGKGQKQGRTRADNGLHFVICNGAPRARAFARRKLRVPFRRAHAEAFRETIEELRGERDFRHQDQHLLAAPDRLGHGLKIDFGLSRAGDAVDQGDGIFAFDNKIARRVRGVTLHIDEIRLHEIGIGQLRDRIGRQHNRLERAFIDQSVDHRGRDAGFMRGIVLCARHAVFEQPQHA